MNKDKLMSLMTAAIRYLLKGSLILESKVDKTAVVRRGCRVYESSIGRYSYATRDCLIHHAKIGAFCSISENCRLGLPSHPTHLVSTSPVFLEGENYLGTNFSMIKHSPYRTTMIGNDVWIGENAIVMGGVKIGDGAIIGAGAVVTRDVEPYAIVGGVPAKLLRKRFDDDTIAKLLNSHWWELPEEKLRIVAYHMNDVPTFLKELER